jgi:hypothetical protein
MRLYNVEFYNKERLYMNIDMMTPAEAKESTGDRDMRWTSYRLLAMKARDNLDIFENSLPLDLHRGSTHGTPPAVNPYQ